MTEVEIWNNFQQGRIVDALAFIGIIIAVWLSLRIANMTRENDESNLLNKLLGTGFGLLVVWGSFIAFANATATWVITARGISNLESPADPEGAQRFIDFVGTTEWSGLPSLTGMIWLGIITVMILGLIWTPKK
jgi:TRAP-type C4-dicarboxylate transport system permease small subunit|tara:strand:+ start:37 stop:438 length:402 start_codon:yes stop_codon:yes gene_type:complete